MTYGVPYAFVPGTKAKADEVNANFIDVLEKIQTSNTKISQLEAGKAENSDIDGNWVKIGHQIAENVNLNGNSALEIDIASYLPNDDNLYEVMIDANIQSSTTAGQYCCLIMSGSGNLGTYVAVCRPRTNAYIQSGGQAILLVDNNKKIYMNRATNYYGTANINFKYYRKVR